MTLYEEIVTKVLGDAVRSIVFPKIDIDTTKIVEQISYQALQKIKAVIEDDSLDDTECFHKIEEIVRVFEEIGSDGGNRHDF